jgi:dolichyl-phosphate beta-glucosyltransferase
VNKDSVYLSIIIGSYNSYEALSRNLDVLLDYLKTKTFSYEVIIVDDGSTDNDLTKNISEKKACIYLKNETNLGKGAAIRNGMLNANGEYRIFTDADIPYDPLIIDTFLRYLDFKEFHMVVGDRTLGETNYYDDVKMVRSWASKIFAFIVGRFIAGGMFDTQCGIKGFRAEIAEDIFSVARIDGFAFDVEAFYIALKRNYDIKRLPVKLRSQDGKSVNVVKNSILMLLDIPKILLNYYTNKYQKIKNPVNAKNN